jgi:hypothetical protein
MKKLIIYSTLFLTLTGGLAGCKKILSKVDLNGVPQQQVWSNAGTANLYLDNLYSLVMPVFYSNTGSSTVPSSFHNVSDECNGGTSAIIQGTLTSESETDFFTSTSTGYYPYLRKINTLFDNIDKYGLSPDVTAPIKAQAYFLRAWTYFQLVKVYGGVPYLTHAQDWIVDSLNVPRNATSDCINLMLSDLAHCSILPTSWSGADQGRVTSAAALALKGRILLYWASPQFNPGNDATRWQQAYQANEAAFDSLTNEGFALYPNYSRVFLDATVATNKELIFWRAYNASTTISANTNNWENSVRPYSQSATGGGKSYNPTWQMVQAYPMADGYPITKSSASLPYDSVYYWKNRDPRFYSTIVYNGSVYGIGGISGRKQWSYTGIPEDKTSPTTTGFYCRRNVDTSVTPANSQYNKTWWVELRFAEVMLNVAECANATGNQAEAYTMLINIRKRAGIKANADNLYGLTAGMSQQQIQAAIMQERRIEFAFEDKRYDDLRRTRTFDALNGLVRSQLVITVKSPFITSTAAKDTNNVNNIERIISGGIKVRDTIDVNGPSYTKYFTVAVKPITNELPFNFLTTYYAYGIPSSNIAKDVNLQQTVGWPYLGAAGTFDPTK